MNTKDEWRVVGSVRLDVKDSAPLEKPRFPWVWFLLPFDLMILTALLYLVWFRA